MIEARRPADARPPAVVDDPALLAGYLEDASGAPPGRTPGLARPQNEAEAAALLREAARRRTPLLFQAARTSLTAGAIPHGEIVVSVERMTAIGPLVPAPGGARITVEPGVRLDALQAHLAERGYYFPPVPTYAQAMLGGSVSTNAGGAASFKYGVTRDWVRGLRVLLAGGDLLALEREEARAPRGGSFRIRRTGGDVVEVPTPSHVLPPLKKISAGYHSADPLDLVDLFVGAEGTLGLLTAITLDVVPLPAATLAGLAFVDDAGRMLALAAALRDAASAARRAGDAAGPDVRAIESLDRGALALARPAAERLRLPPPAGAAAALLFEVELPEALTREQAEQRLGAADGPLPRLLRLLERHAALDTLQLAFPDDAARRADLFALREAAPLGTAELLARRRRDDPEVVKVAGDLIVPFERLGRMLDVYDEGFRRRGLEYAIWGHVSDGNLHPNVLARDAAEARRGREAQLEFAREAARLGGAPLSEHGVGRSPLKQEILREFLGAAAIARMREIKRALDPLGLLAPGVIFPALG